MWIIHSTKVNGIQSFQVGLLQRLLVLDSVICGLKETGVITNSGMLLTHTHTHRWGDHLHEHNNIVLLVLPMLYSWFYYQKKYNIN